MGNYKLLTMHDCYKALTFSKLIKIDKVGRTIKVIISTINTAVIRPSCACRYRDNRHLTFITGV